MTGQADSSLARTVFALLVAASFAAFFVTQRLKHTPTAVQAIMRSPYFSPTAGGLHRLEKISFRISHTDEVMVTVVNSTGDDVATLTPRAVLMQRYVRRRFFWNGRTDAGHLAPDGEYRVRVRLRRQGRSVLSPRTFRLDTTPPRPRVTAIVPQNGPAPAAGPPVLPSPAGGGVKIEFTPDVGGAATKFDGGRDPQLFLYRTDVSPPQLIEGLPIAPGATSATWDGTVKGHAAPAGVYLVAIRSHDPAGNWGSDPLVLPPVAAHPPAGRAGITVRYLGVQPPSVAAVQRSSTAFGVDARGRPYRWSLARAGASRPRTLGGATKSILAMNAPGGVSGLYLLGVASQTSSLDVPLLVQDVIHQPVLVVVPSITWLGQNAADEDGDGIPDTLDNGQAVPRERVFAATPYSLGAQVAPVLAYLDRNRLRYDLTSDLALAANPQGVLAGHRGVLLPGDERWITPGLAQALRAYVSSGGMLASLGLASLRAQVTMAGNRLGSPTPVGDVDALGARLGAPATASGPITDLQDGIGLFRGGDGRFTGYAQYEPVENPGGAKVVSSAVAPGGAPVIVAAQLGKGMWMRTGLAGLQSRVASDPNGSALLRRIWTLLAGGR